MFLQQKTVKVHCLKASFATLLVIGLLFNCLPSVSEAHSQKETYFVHTTTRVVEKGWMWVPIEGTDEWEYIYTIVSETITTSTSTYESEVSHSHPPWDKIVSAVAAVATAGAAVYKAVKGGNPPTP